MAAAPQAAQLVVVFVIPVFFVFSSYYFISLNTSCLCHCIVRPKASQ